MQHSRLLRGRDADPAAFGADLPRVLEAVGRLHVAIGVERAALAVADAVERGHDLGRDSVGFIEDRLVGVSVELGVLAGRELLVDLQLVEQDEADVFQIGPKIEGAHDASVRPAAA